MSDTPVVALTHAVSVGMDRRPEHGLELLDPLQADGAPPHDPRMMLTVLLYGCPTG